MIKKFIGFFALILILHNCVLLVVTSHVDTDLNEIVSRSEREYHEKPHVRETRYAKPLSGIFGFFSTLGSITQIFSEQHIETKSALQRVYDILADGFTDTATTKRPSAIETTTEPKVENGTTEEPTTTTEKYRISRKELGYILGRNYRGLQKLLRIELTDALNQTQYSINDYKQEFGNALAPYAVPKVVRSARHTSKDSNV